MTVVVDNLEKDGLVERTVCKDDRRAFTVGLTSKGRRLFEKVFLPHAEYVSKLVSILSETEQSELGDLLKKLGTGLRETKE